MNVYSRLLLTVSAMLAGAMGSVAQDQAISGPQTSAGTPHLKPLSQDGYSALRKQVIDKLRAGSASEALAAASALRDNYPLRASAGQLYAYALLRVGSFSQSREVLGALPEDARTDPVTIVYSGFVATKLGDLEGAKALWQTVEKPKFAFEGLSSGMPLPEREGLASAWSFMMGKLCLESEVDVNFGAECLQKLIHDHPNLLAVRYVLATHFIGAKEYRKGIDQLVFIYDHSTGSLRSAIGAQLSDIAKVYQDGGS